MRPGRGYGEAAPADSREAAPEEGDSVSMEEEAVAPDVGSAGEGDLPATVRREMSWFWQKRQPRGQPVKKMVPEPVDPDRQGSSHMWRPTRAMRSSEVMPQYPRWPKLRFAPHARGHRTQWSYGEKGV